MVTLTWPAYPLLCHTFTGLRPLCSVRVREKSERERTRQRERAKRRGDVPVAQGKAEGAGGSAMASGSGLSSGEVELALAMEGQAVAARGSGVQRRAWRRSASSRAEKESSGGELLGFGADFFLFPVVAE